MSARNSILSLWKSKGRGSHNENKTPQTGFGLHTLNPRDADAEGMVDIVAIHGLNGHYQTTWTDEKTGVNWLCDRKISKHARVLSFSYNSAVQFSKSVSDIFDFADQLLEGLLAARVSEAELDRPILFVCHSLGGIVFKQALVRVYENERYRELPARISGVLFFGTPHRGSDMAKWASILGAVVKAGSMSSSTNTGIPKDLVPGSRVLQTISRSFIERSRQLKIYSFFETQKMDFMSDVVVDRGSAVLGLDNEVTIPIDGNHRTMCRFSDPQEPRYQPVITILARLINEVLQKGKRHNANTKDVVSTMLASFTHPDFRQHKDRNPLPLPGTCTWLLDNPVYTDWLKDVDSCLLWVSADPGCGKSVIASHLINTRMGIGPDKELDLCYFFFKTDYQDQRSAVVGLQGLLLQLFERYPTLKKFAAELMGDRSTESIDILWEVFVKVVLKRRISDHISAQCTFCILDGLDECDKVDRRIFTRLISQTFGLATSKESEKTTLDDASEMTSIKMLVLSRPDNAIKVAFDRPTPLDPPGSPQKRRAAMIRLRGEDETRAISADVGRVINASVKGLIEQGLPHDLLGDIQRQLVKRADRTFLWVTLILQLLAEKVETGVSRRELHSILDNRDIDKLYSDLLVMRPDVAKARKVLSILLAAVRPLTVAQMSIALAVEPDHDILRPANHPRRPDYSTFQDLEDNLVYPFETHLKFICGNFIRIIQNKVYLVHETAREFLLGSWSDSYHGVHYQKLAPVWDEIQSTVRFQTNTTSVPQTALDGKPNTSIPTPAIHTNSPWQHSFTLVESNALILQICTTFLYMTAKKSDLSIVGKPSEKATEFLSYAAQSWSRHFGAIREFVRLKDLRYYENLCHPAFPGFDSWTEALLGSYGRTNVIVGRSMDQIQDHLVKLLGIELTGPSNDDNSSSGGGASENEEDDGDQVNDPLSTRALADEAMTRLSSNPASQTNSYFPILVDETGFVGININATSGGYRTNYRNRPAR